MQAFGPPDEGPLRGLADSHVENYRGRHRASAQSTAVSVYPRGSPVLVSPGCAPEVTWVGQEGGHPGFQVSAFYRIMGSSIPIPHPTFLPGWEREEGRAGPGSQDSTPIPDRWGMQGREPGEARP